MASQRERELKRVWASHNTAMIYRGLGGNIYNTSPSHTERKESEALKARQPFSQMHSVSSPFLSVSVFHSFTQFLFFSLVVKMYQMFLLLGRPAVDVSFICAADKLVQMTKDILYNGFIQSEFNPFLSDNVNKLPPLLTTSGKHHSRAVVPRLFSAMPLFGNHPQKNIYSHII